MRVIIRERLFESLLRKGTIKGSEFNLLFINNKVDISHSQLFKG